MTIVGANPLVKTVLVVDDHLIFVDLLQIAIDGEPHLSCVGTAHGVAGAIVAAERLRPDFIVMDAHLPDGEGVQATATITSRDPAVRVIVLTAHADASLIRQAASSGACGLLPKNGSLPELLEAFRAARRGEFFVQPALMRTLILQDDTLPPLPSFCKREYQVLQMLAIGMHAEPIASQLEISVNTCRGYIKTVLSKLNAHSQLEAVALARKHGLIRVPTSR